MKIQYKFLLTFFLLIVIGFLFYSTWVQWQGNQQTRIERMKPVKPTVEFKNGKRIHSMTFSPIDSNIIATTSEGNRAKIWNVHSKENPIQTLTTDSVKSQNSIYPVDCIAYSKSGEWLLNKTYSTLVFWHVASNREITIDTIRSFSAAVSPYEDILALGLNDIRLWDFSDPNVLKPLYVLPPRIGDEPLSHKDAELILHQNVVIDQFYSNITFSYDGKWLAASGQMYDKLKRRHIDKVKVWNLRSKKLVKIIERPIPNDVKENEYRQDIQSISFSPDNRFFAITGKTGLTIWSTKDWKIYKEMLNEKHIDVLYSAEVTFSPDGRFYAISGLGDITLLKLDNDTPIALLKGNSLLSIYNHIMFSPDGKHLVSKGLGGVLSIWNIENLKKNSSFDKLDESSQSEL